jgi:hypothetical protein
MANWTKRNPTPASALSSPKLNTLMNSYLFRMLFLEPLQLLLCLFVIRVLNFKLRFKLGYLRLKFAYLSLQHRKLVSSKRKLLAKYRSRAMLGDQLLYAVKDIHVGDGVVMPIKGSVLGTDPFTTGKVRRCDFFDYWMRIIVIVIQGL